MKDIDKRYEKIQSVKENFHKKHRKPFTISFFIVLFLFITLFILYINGSLKQII